MTLNKHPKLRQASNCHVCPSVSRPMVNSGYPACSYWQCSGRLAVQGLDVGRIRFARNRVAVFISVAIWYCDTICTAIKSFHACPWGAPKGFNSKFLLGDYWLVPTLGFWFLSLLTLLKQHILGGKSHGSRLWKFRPALFLTCHQISIRAEKLLQHWTEAFILFVQPNLTNLHAISLTLVRERRPELF